MSMQITRVWWDGDKLMADPINELEVYKPEPVTEWLTCPKCAHKSPYSPIKAKTWAEDAERVTKQARAAIEQMRVADEPVAWLYQIKPDGNMAVSLQMMQSIDHEHVRETPLYTHPQPKRKWVGLTDEEIHDIYDHVAKQEPYSGAVTRRNVARAIEAKLREKNSRWPS